MGSQSAKSLSRRPLPVISTFTSSNQVHTPGASSSPGNYVKPLKSNNAFSPFILYSTLNQYTFPQSNLITRSCGTISVSILNHTKHHKFTHLIPSPFIQGAITLRNHSPLYTAIRPGASATTYCLISSSKPNDLAIVLSF